MIAIQCVAAATRAREHGTAPAAASAVGEKGSILAISTQKRHGVLFPTGETSKLLTPARPLAKTDDQNTEKCHSEFPPVSRRHERLMRPWPSKLQPRHRTQTRARGSLPQPLEETFTGLLPRPGGFTAVCNREQSRGGARHHQHIGAGKK